MPLRHLHSTKPSVSPKAGGTDAFEEVAALRGSRHFSGEFHDDVADEGKDAETSKTAAIVRISAREILAAKDAAKNFSGPGAALVPMAVASAVEEVRVAVEDVLDAQEFMTKEDFEREDAETRRIADERALAMAEVIRKIEAQEKAAIRALHKRNLAAKRELKKRKELAEAAAKERAAEQELDGLGAFQAFDGAAAQPAHQAPIAGPGSQSRKRAGHKRAKPVSQDEIAAAKREEDQENEDLALFGSLAHHFSHDQEGGLAYLAKIRAANLDAEWRALLLKMVESEKKTPETALENVLRVRILTPAKPKTTRKIA